MAPKRIWEEDTLGRRIVSLSERMLRLRALASDLPKPARERLEAALFELEQELDHVQPEDPEGELLKAVHFELDRRKISASQVARDLEISRQSLHAIFTGRSHLGAKMNGKLTRWVSTSRTLPDAKP